MLTESVYYMYLYEYEYKVGQNSRVVSGIHYSSGIDVGFVSYRVERNGTTESLFSFFTFYNKNKNKTVVHKIMKTRKVYRLRN